MIRIKGQRYDAQTGLTEIVEEDFDETLISQSEPTPIELSAEERLDQIEPTLTTVVETLATIVGVE
jgi:hypothetical protein